MKKIFILICSTICILVITNCTSDSKVISEINSTVQSYEKFASISMTYFSNIGQGLYVAKVGEKNIRALIRFVGISETDDLNSVINSITFITCSMYNFEEQTYKRIVFFADGNIKVLKDEKLHDGVKPYGQESWEDTPRGIAIAEDKINLKLIESTDSSKWQILFGKYDLSNEQYLKNRIWELNGSLTLWYNDKDLTAVELYKNDLKKWSLIRRFWLEEDPKIDFNQISFDNLLNDFLNYYNKANFLKFLSNQLN